MNIYHIIFLCFVSAIFVVYLIDRYTGHKLTLAIIQWKPAIVALCALVKAIAAVLPSSYFSIVSVVLEAASDATQEAEKLYMMNQIPKEERNEYAQRMIVDILEQANIHVDTQIQQIIDGCIAVVCMLMPHGVEPEAQPTNKTFA